MTFLGKLFARPGHKNKAANRAARLQVEALEERTVLAVASVVPLAQGIDGVTTFHRLQDAVNAAASGDTVLIEPGTTADLGPVTVNTGRLTITGDPNIPASILPSYNVVVNASNVTLTRLNLGLVTINAGLTGDAVTRSTVNTINVTGAANALIDQDAVSGYVSAIGLPSAPELNATITNNIFNTLVPSTASPIINVQDANNAIVQNNTITGGGPATQIGIQVTRGLNNLVANNTVHLSGADLNTEGILLQNPGFNSAMLLLVRNNTLATGQGHGLYISALNDATMQAVVQGNDLHNNAVGVEYVGANSGAIATDLGGGFNAAGSSLGGNDFRGFPTQGTPGNAAIVLRNVPLGGVLAAHWNIFANPSLAQEAVVTVAGAGMVDVGQTLDSNRAFVQTLYNNMLGRTGTIAELNSWLPLLTASASGQANVLNGTLRSEEALTRIVDQYYLQYLGRTADAGVVYWVNQIKGGMTLEQVQAGFLASPEFLSDNNSDYVQGLYRTFFGRTGNASELAYWYTQLPSLGLSGVARAFSQSPENRHDQLTALFSDFLHRTPTAGDLSLWSTQPGDLLTVEVNLLASGEFFVNG